MIFGFDQFELDAEKLELRRDGTPVRADALVLRLLAVLLQHAGRLVTKQQLVSWVWGDRAVSENVITVAMTRLRKTLGNQPGRPEFVSTVHGRGYRFTHPVTSRSDWLRSLVVPSTPTIRGLPFVGRERVLERLRAVLAEARGGQGSTCVLLGEAGIGKTTVAEVIESEATAAGMFVAFSHCREAGDTPPLFPFVQLSRELLERAQVDLDEPRLAIAVRELRRLLPELDPEPVREDAREPGAAVAAFGVATHRTFDTLVRVLSLVSEQRPCVLVFDDLHRADSASLELLRYWVDEIGRTRICVLATLRKGITLEAPSNAHLSYLLGHRNCTRLMLDPLHEEDVALYVASVLGDPDVVLGRAVFAKSEGNPFFMAEFARLLRDGEHQDASALRVPEAALGLLRQRVSALDATLRGALSAAAVIGRNFDFGLLMTVSELDSDTLMESLDRALDGEIVVLRGDSTTSFAFGHDLLRAALYERLSKGERRTIHLRVVAALEQRVAGGNPVPPADLAYHAHSALPQGDPRKAVRACRDAANAAGRLRAYGDGVRYLRHAREALDLVPSPSPRLRLALLLQEVVFARVCSSPQFGPLVREAMSLAREQGAGPALARAALMLDVNPGFPASPGSRAALEDALAILSPEEDESRAAILARLAMSAPLVYDAERSALQVSEGLRLAQKTNSLLGIYAARTAELYVRGGPAHGERGTFLLGVLQELHERNPDTLSVAPVLLDLHRAIRAAQNGDLPVVDTVLDRAEGICRQLGNLELLWHVERFRLVSRANTGDGTDISRPLRELHARAEREEIIGGPSFVAYDAGVVLREPLPSLRPGALSFDRDDRPNLWSLKVRALTALGRHEEARRSLRAVSPDGVARLPCDRDYLGTLGALARVSVALGELDYVEVIGGLLAPYPDHFAVHITFYCEGSVRELLGAIAQALGRPADAKLLFESAVEHSERVGFLASAARARRALAP